MRDIVSRAIHARPELTAELLRRGMFGPEEKAEVLRHPFGEQSRYPPLGPVQFATLLAQGDSQLAARAVLRDLLTRDELSWLELVLRFQKHNAKRDELVRIAERALEGRKGKCPRPSVKSRR